MHSLVRRYLKTAIAFLGVGLALGGWMIVDREFRGVAPDAYLNSAHTRAIFVGFVMMMILGVALWLFPRPEKGDSRYRPQVIGTAWWLVTTGSATRVAERQGLHRCGQHQAGRAVCGAGKAKPTAAEYFHNVMDEKMHIARAERKSGVRVLDPRECAGVVYFLPTRSRRTE